MNPRIAERLTPAQALEAIRGLVLQHPNAASRIAEVLAAVVYNERCECARRVKNYADDYARAGNRERAVTAEHAAFLCHGGGA